MTLAQRLHEHQDAIVRKWLDGALATYPEDSSAAFKKPKDPFANPVGHSLREGTQGIFEALTGEMDAETIRRHLHEIIRIRAVQQLSASEGLRFIFELKDIIRTELAEAVTDPRVSPELARLEGQIDRIALMAFDVFVQCREQVCELRVNEVKRRVSWVMDKMNQRGFGPGLAPGDSG